MHWTHEEQHLAIYLHMGVQDLQAVHRNNDASVRAMRYSALLADRLWSMVEIERARVRLCCDYPYPDIDFQNRETVLSASCRGLVMRSQS
jgi:hypothetical protein